MSWATLRRYLLFALFLLSVSAAAFAQIQVYVSFGPPPIPVYEQPICPGDGYIWIPGYWAWDGYEYYWVPGSWVLPPTIGVLWTPGYWEWGGSGFFFHQGYWGPHVGFYGGINYGFGYFGRGYEGGRWDGEHFFYNRAVNNINVTVINNVYENRVVYNNTSRVSYNGGNGGVNQRPTSEESTFSREQHFAPTNAQTQHMEAARTDKELRSTANQGRPPVAATERPGAFNDHAVAASEAGGRWEPPAANPTRPAIHPNDLPPPERSPAPYTGNTQLEQKYQQQQEKLYNDQVQERQNLQQRQQREDQNLARQNASTNKTQQMEQSHQQQTQQMQQRHEQQQQQIRQSQLQH